MASKPILLLTRPQAASRRFLAQIPKPVAGCVQPVISPLQQIVPLSEALDLAGAQSLIFTSRNGVEIAASLTANREAGVYTVGQSTAEAATDAGWTARCLGQTADDFVTHALQMAEAAPFLHLHGRHTRGDIAARLTAADVPTTGLAIYDQVASPPSPQALAALGGESPVIVPLFSPRSARLFAGIPDITAPLNFLALSAAVADQIRKSHAVQLHICAEPTATAMHAALCDAVNQLCRVEGTMRQE